MKRRKNLAFMLITIPLIAEEIIPGEFLYMLLVVGVIVLLKLNNWRTPRKIVGKQSLLLWLFILGICIGMLNLVHLNMLSFARDIFYFSFPIIILIYISLLSMIFGKNNELLNSIIYAAAVLSVIYLINFLLNKNSVMDQSNIWVYRKETGTGYFIVPIALSILLFSKQFSFFTMKKWKKICLIFLLSSHVILSFSRTVMIIFIIFFFILFPKRNLRKTLIFCFTILIILPFLYEGIKLFSTNELLKQYINKIVTSFVEMSKNEDWSDKMNIVANWRGYETFSALTEFRSLNSLTKLIGNGFGAEIEVGHFAELVGGSGTTIPVLHNGYLALLIKVGISGLLVYLFFLLSNIYYYVRLVIYKKNVYYKLVLSSFLSILVFTYFSTGIFQVQPRLVFLFIIGYYYKYRGEYYNEDISILPSTVS
ncbi:MAG: hypothetical protein ACLR3E_02520 [Enterococcus durans]